MTCDDFRRKFITSKQSAIESPPQFLARLEHYLLRWIALSKTEETFQSLRDLMLREQFMISVSRELSIFLRENAADDLDAMFELAHKFTMARDHVAYTEPAAGRSRQSPIKATHEARGSEARTQYSPPRCFSCGNTGHLRNSCPNSERRFVGVRGRQDERYRENGGGSGKPRGPDHRNKPFGLAMPPWLSVTSSTSIRLIIVTRSCNAVVVYPLWQDLVLETAGSFRSAMDT